MCVKSPLFGCLLLLLLLLLLLSLLFVKQDDVVAAWNATATKFARITGSDAKEIACDADAMACAVETSVPLTAAEVADLEAAAAVASVQLTSDTSLGPQLAESIQQQLRTCLVVVVVVVVVVCGVCV